MPTQSRQRKSQELRGNHHVGSMLAGKEIKLRPRVVCLYVQNRATYGYAEYALPVSYHDGY